MPQVFPPSDELRNLLPLSWRGIAVPIGPVTVDGGHTLIDHMMPDLDFAREEETGQVPDVVQVRMYFRTGIIFDPTAQGIAQPLFPFVADQMMAALRDGSTGDLVHPQFGAMRAKVQTWKHTLDPTRRDGCDIDVVFKRTNEDDAQPTPRAPQASALTAAIELDGEMANLASTQAALYAQIIGSAPAPTFADLVRNVQASVDTVSAVARKGAGSLDSTIYAVQNLTASLDRAHDVSTAGAKQAAERLTAGLNTLRGNVGKQGSIGFYTVPAGLTMTVARVAIVCSTTSAEILKLNPQLDGAVTVREGTVVRYPHP